MNIEKAIEELTGKKEKYESMAKAISVVVSALENQLNR